MQTAWPAPPWQNGHVKKTAITIALNGAEYLELSAAAMAAGLSVPAYVRTRCGFPAWLARAVEMGSRQPASGRPVRLALERRTVTIHLTPEEHADLDARDSIPNGPGLPLPQFIRTLLGLEVRFSSMPESDERVREVDDAWDRLMRLGLDPKDYFED